MKTSLARSPGIVSRIKESVMLSPIPGEKVQAGGKEMGSIGITKGASSRHLKSNSLQQKLLTTEALESLTPEQQQSIKIAFAEGYLAADNKKSPSRTMKWLKVTQQLLTILLFMGVIISLMG
jgi:hypothetical protein